MSADLPAPAPRKRKRADEIADHLRARIARQGLIPGDRLPDIWLEDDETLASRGTVREAMRILQAEGLVKSRTGPGGGHFVQAVDPAHALRLLENLFLFEQPTLPDVYALRRALEPLLAAELAGKLSDADLERLEATILQYDHPPATAEEEYRQRLSELDFHVELARRSENRLLGFVVTFLLNLLQEKTECREIYATPQPELRETGLRYQRALLLALADGTSERASEIMSKHMTEAEARMVRTARFRTG